jgi:shikimate dehydrogenase
LRSGSITVVGRRLENLEAYAGKFGCRTKLLNDMGDNTAHADIIINTTPVSGREEAPKLAELTGKLSADNCELVIDLNYDREYNVWKEMAERKSIRFVDGLTVLAHSARRTLMLWTKIDVEPHEFIRALENE